VAAKTDKSAEKSSLSPEIIEIKDLYEMMVTEGLDAIEIKNEDRHIKLSRQSTAPVYMPSPVARSSSAPARPVAVAAPAAGGAPTGESIKAPLAGVFYRSSSPSNPPFAKEGDTVEPGQTLCIVEAMKVMNEIKAEKRCKIVKIAAENSRPVSVGQPLFWIE